MYVNRTVATLATPTLVRRRMDYSALLNDSGSKAEYLLMNILEDDSQSSPDQ